MSSIQAVVLNHLLMALPEKDRLHLLANCEVVELKVAEVLAVSGDSIKYVYFPTGSVISLAMLVDNNSSLEVRLIGNEGMLGITLMLGVELSPFNAVVQGGGSAFRMAAPLFLIELEKSHAIRTELNRYLYVLIRQLMQTSGCHRFHLAEARLARLLLMIKDRAHSDEFHITQLLLAQMLGVRRVGVTKAAGSLQKKKLISYSRGNVRIQDVPGLEAASCSCYQIDKNTYDHVLHH